MFGANFTGVDGELIPLMEQDRSLWKQAEIAEGVSHELAPNLQLSHLGTAAR